MRTVVICYFSGTGNTEIIANMIRDEFNKNQYLVDVIRIEDILRNNIKIDIQKYDLIGIGSQVIGYSTPNLVKNFIRRLPEGKNKKIFIFRTAGGVAPINYNASKPVIRTLTRKGYNVFYERVFSISSNWIVKFDDDIIIKLYDAAKRKAGFMCQEIIRGEKRILRTGLIRKLLMEFVAKISPVFFRFTGKDFFVDKTCTHCGLCIKNCPAGNIYKKNNKIKFKLLCNSCMRCVYSCPKNAIKYRILKFFPVAGGYNIKKTLEQPCITSKKARRPEPPFFNDYVKNDSL